MRRARSLRTLLLGIWMVMTGLVVVVSTVITAMEKSEET
jgi:hypothetical protein